MDLRKKKNNNYTEKRKYTKNKTKIVKQSNEQSNIDLEQSFENHLHLSPDPASSEQEEVTKKKVANKKFKKGRCVYTKDEEFSSLEMCDTANRNKSEYFMKVTQNNVTNCNIFDNDDHNMNQIYYKCVCNEDDCNLK